MTENSNPNALPATYRLGLSVSLALFLHTLILTGIPSPIEDKVATHSESMHFTLVSPGSHKPTVNMPGKASATETATQIAPSNQETPESESLPQPMLMSTHQPGTLAPRAQTSSRSPISKPALARVSASTGTKPQKPTASENPESHITRVTESPAELDPYVVKLAIHLAQQLEELRIPALRDLNGAVEMAVELQLLGNGALTQAKVLNSTGIKSIDAAAYRAALAASPYPQPPENDGGNRKNRFEVDLLFTPKRL